MQDEQYAGTPKLFFGGRFQQNKKQFLTQILYVYRLFVGCKQPANTAVITL